jgi:hypothetical protein
MTDLRKAAEMALAALNSFDPHDDEYWYSERSADEIDAAIAELRQALAESANSTTDFVEPKALAQPEQEPVLWFNPNAGTIEYSVSDEPAGEWNVPLYTAPPKREWVGLTDGEIAKADCVAMDYIGAGEYGLAEETIFDFAKAIEAKLKEKNT